MATMVSEMYDALVEAGASQEKARKAAEALAGYDTRFSSVDQRMVETKGDLTLLKWMIGFNLALSVSVLLKLFI